MKTVRFVPDAIQYRLEWQVENSTPTTKKAGYLPHFAYSDHSCAERAVCEPRLCMDAISTLQTLCGDGSLSISLCTQGGVSVGPEILANSQMQASLLWGIVKSVVASGLTFSSVRDTFPSTASQKASGLCHFNVLDSQTQAGVANLHSGNVLKGGASYDSRLLHVPDLPLNRARYEIGPYPRGSLSNMMVEFAPEEIVQ